MHEPARPLLLKLIIESPPLVITSEPNHKLELNILDESSTIKFNNVNNNSEGNPPDYNNISSDEAIITIISGSDVPLKVEQLKSSASLLDNKSHTTHSNPTLSIPSKSQRLPLTPYIPTKPLAFRLTPKQSVTPTTKSHILPLTPPPSAPLKPLPHMIRKQAAAPTTKSYILPLTPKPSAPIIPLPYSMPKQSVAPKFHILHLTPKPSAPIKPLPQSTTKQPTITKSHNFPSTPYIPSKPLPQSAIKQSNTYRQTTTSIPKQSTVAPT